MSTAVNPPQSIDPLDQVATARAAFASGRTRPLAWRLRQLEGITRLVDERETEIAAALHEDLGRSAVEAWLGDIAATKGEAEHARKRLRWWMRPRPQPLPLNQLPATAWVQYEPLGTVLIVGPWNYPVYLTLGPLVAAVAAGNAAVVKPSEITPVTSALLARLIPQYLDPGAVTVVEGDGAVTQQLLAQGLDHVLFTGGTEVGRKILEGAAPTLTPVTLELGGKSPVVVTADSDLDVAARRIAWVKLLNSGQTCIAPDYVLVERSVRDALVSRLVATIRDFREGEDAHGLRIVNQRQLDRLESYLTSTSGVIRTGGAVDRERLAITPTVVVDPDPDEPLMTDEIFGPILPVLTIDSVAEAVAFINARPKPLAAYYFTRSREVRKKLLTEVSSGGAVVNHVAMHCLVPQLPFGGVGDSGMGAYHGKWGFETLSLVPPMLRSARSDSR
ncbi:aldehyde dehydrogenase family protein [Dietzia maris]|uniref:aldehyde dehydrogenase family protein n=1 Tax=Dietzia maris TaxID=37915 RepID=UPI0037C77727